MDEKETTVLPSRKTIRIALAGNPNSGKTTIFNNLTGARQHVGNYPGVTVEKKDGRFSHGNREIHVTDLPGTYSLTAYTMEEVIARNFLIGERPDVVVDVLDASNLERNLYLAVQLMELDVPLVLAFNMSDVAKSQGVEFDLQLLSELLGVEIVTTVGHKSRGMDELKEAVIRVADGKAVHEPRTVSYGKEIDGELAKIMSLLEKDTALTREVNARWLAVKLIERDKEVQRKVEETAAEPAAIFSVVETACHHIERDFGDVAEIAIADRRYGFISGACQEAVKMTVEARHSISDHIDSVVTNRILGLPIFLCLMYAVFKLTFALGDAPMGWIEGGFEWLGGAVESLWAEGSESALKSLLVDGVIGGVGGVLIFLPNILLLFLAIAFLESTGYMARAAFIIDRLMHKIGLHGKSFIPMLIGFGCTVPAIMATRTLETRRDRLTTMLVLPLMSCGARLPIYALFIPAFFPEQWHAPVLWLIYFVGIALAIITAKLLRATLFKGEAAPFVMELPIYRMPTLKGILMHMWERTWLFLRKAGTVIVVISILLWAMGSYPKAPESSLADMDENQAANAQLSYSMAGRVGQAFEPLTRPIGFDWKTNVAMIGAFAAKEVFVAQLGIIHSLGEADEESEPLRETLKREYTPLQAVSILLFCLISAPCMVTIAATWRESGSWKWALLQLGGLTGLAYFVSLITYQAGLLLGVGVG